ncbi:MAG TPA: thioredoxin domain-containing protein [Solirubrobacteraceae bacterium]|jgi:hypothetical protein|nr:thioredoxin domain-containing protein [Solirubrobacteraceae bacterium]
MSAARAPTHRRDALSGAPRGRLFATAVATAALALSATTACGREASPPHTVATTAGGVPTVPAHIAPAAARRIGNLLAGIPQSGNYLGSPTAPVTLQYFADVLCPSSREITTGPLASIIRNWVRTGKLRIEFRSNEEGSEPAEAIAIQQVAALAAAKQGKLWFYLEYAYQILNEMGSNFRDTCYPPTEYFPQTVAQRIPGLDFARWSRDRHSAQLGHEVAADDQAIAHIQVKGPAHPTPRYPNPAYLIGFTETHAAMPLAKFRSVAPAYDAVAQALISAKVVAG